MQLSWHTAESTCAHIETCRSFQDKVMWSHTILVYFSTGYLVGKSQFICTSCHTALSLPRKEILHILLTIRISSLSLFLILCPVFLSLPLFPLSFFSSSNPAIFHLNISSSCLAASAACQVSSRSQSPTLKWSMEVVFRVVCVRKRETDREKEKGWDEKEKLLGWGLRHRVVIGSEKVEKTWEW